MYRFPFLGKEKPQNTQFVLAIAWTLIEIDLPRKAYCIVCVAIRPVTVLLRPVTVLIRPVTVLIRPVTVPIRPVTVLIRPVTVPIRPVTVRLSRRIFQERGCSTSCLQLWCTLLYCNQGCSQCIVLYTVQPPRLRCSQSCHQFVAKHTLMPFITDLGSFVSWGNYNDKTCFSLLDAVSSDLLTTAPAHLDKHI